MDLMDIDRPDIPVNETNLIKFIDAMIKLLENVKIDAKNEVETGYFTLNHIGNKLDCYGLNIERAQERAEKRFKATFH